MVVTEGWTRRLPRPRIAASVRALLKAGWLDDDAPAVLVHDMHWLDGRLDALGQAFPADALHAIAIKANPEPAILRHVVAAGFGLEAASWEEVELARAAGCDPAAIVFDSPAKTRRELADALALGVVLNVDNDEELARLDALRPPPGAAIGLRINPAVGAGSIAMTSVADVRSRFGLPYLGDAEALAQRFVRYPWLDGLHAHVGSQGVKLSQLVEAARRLVDVATAIEAATGRALARFDIGGGLPADYGHGETPPTLDAYVSALRAACPRLFAPGVRLVTELGRAVQAGCGFAVSRVEYVKSLPGRRLATIHVGADLFVRTAYQPDVWWHEITVLDPEGTPKPGPSSEWTIVGPLCFAGDVIAEARSLPAIEAGDLLVIHDAGGYTMGMWSSHCSRRRPPVVGVGEDPATLTLLAPRR